MGLYEFLPLRLDIKLTYFISLDLTQVNVK